ncbi:NTP transferase domain-containing protein [Candidatus Bathyarchaeota archaeon]|nr:NTP transferase domain-containing protein [Candidatus Bathyarchaeota archaeon]
MKAVVLAAGKGVRLEPFTLTRPKHLIPVGGRPLLEWLLEGLASSGVKEALIVTYYMGNKIRGYFGGGSDLGLELTYATQRGVLGTADAIGMAEEYVDGEDFLVVYGDLMVSEGAMRRVISAWRDSDGAVMAVVPVEKPSLYGVVEVEGDQVRGIVEKPRPGEEPSNLANAGIYVLPPEIFRYIRETGPSPRGEYEVTDSLQRFIKDGHTLRTVPLERGEWLDVGHPWNLLEANERALQRLEAGVEGRVEEDARLIGPVRVEEDARVRAGAYIEGPVLIGRGSDIGPNCYIRPSTSIGEEVRIGNACEVKNSIIMDRTHVAHLSYVGGQRPGLRLQPGGWDDNGEYQVRQEEREDEYKGEEDRLGEEEAGDLHGG